MNNPQTSPSDLQVRNYALSRHGQVLLSGLGSHVSAVPDPQGIGLFLRLSAPAPLARHVFSLGNLAGFRHWTGCHRYEPFWMKAAAGTRGGEIPPETQFLLLETEDAECVLFAPLLDGPFRSSLQGADEIGLELVAESGDPATVTTETLGLFVAAGPDPYLLMEAAAQRVSAHMGTGRLRREKPLPAFVDQFGWCTWDAFYEDVSHDKVRLGLQSFADGGVAPQMLILDDGWLSERTLPTGERRLTAFQANDKFPGDLAPTVQMARGEFGIRTVLAWHALTGYWGGIDGDALPGYGARPTARAFSPGILHHAPNFNEWWGGIVGLISPEAVYRFFHDFHRHLRRQGIDGVKVDVQSNLEGLAAGWGGRVALMRSYHEALEGSVQTHFGGDLINCMSCSNDMLYSALASSVTRTSTDFWPEQPGSHGLHLYVNAQVSAWFGEFIHPDWDMFQSGHPMGAYHAAGRAVGGCPVYVSDKPDAHDFALLRKLVLPDGSILRARLPGRPTRDCLFHDPTRENVLLKIFNHNLDAGVVGVFNARYAGMGEDMPALAGSVRPADVEGLAGNRFAVYAHGSGDLRGLERGESWDLSLPPLACDVFTIVPVHDGVAPIGLADLFNSAGAITAKGLEGPGVYAVELRSGGRFVAWCETAPVRVDWDDETLAFTYAADRKRLELTAPGTAPCRLRLIFSV